MNRQNLINRLVDRKLWTARSAKTSCVCFVSPNRVRTSAASQGGVSTASPQK